jgi:predicted PurR-regulated permease PerM
LIAVYAGAQAAGVVGMLFALPTIMAIRTLFRIYVQKCENI